MPALELAEFIDKERRTIVAEWESFARTLLPAADGLNALALRLVGSPLSDSGRCVTPPVTRCRQMSCRTGKG